MIDESGLPPLPSMERMQQLLFDAARQGRDDVVPALLHAGVDIEGLDPRGYSALVLASYNGHASTSALLLANGARPDGPEGSTGNSALAGVAFKGRADIARLLIAGGADVHRRNAAGQTALMLAALFDRTEVIAVLLAAGADPQARDHQGNTASSVARTQGNAALADRLDGLAQAS